MTLEKRRGHTAGSYGHGLHLVYRGRNEILLRQHRSKFGAGALPHYHTYSVILPCPPLRTIRYERNSFESKSFRDACLVARMLSDLPLTTTPEGRYERPFYISDERTVEVVGLRHDHGVFAAAPRYETEWYVTVQTHHINDPSKRRDRGCFLDEYVARQVALLLAGLPQSILREVPA